jgi:predicted metalloprotease with PDZ domain
MELQDLNKQLGEYFNAPDGKGVLVTEVETGSSAEKAGFKAGDVITKVGSQSVREMDDIWDEVEEYEEGQSVDVEILRKGSRQSLQLTIEESDYDMWFRGPRSELQWKHGCRCDKDALGNLERDLEIELNRSEPELERLKRELEKLGTEIRDVGRQLREQVLAKIRSVTS